MKRIVLGCVLAAGVGSLAAANTATAQVFQNQPPNPYLQQPVSPYLNLARPGPPGVNYYGLTKPQVDTTKQLQTLQLQQQQQGLLLRQVGTPMEDEGFLNSYAITGHPTAFFNYGHYFGQAGGNIRPAAPPPTVPRKY